MLSSQVSLARSHGRAFRQIAALIAAASVAACSDSSTAPKTSDPASVDVSALVSAATNGSYGTLARSLVLIPAVNVGVVNTANCPYSSTVQEFVCTPVTNNGITFKVAYQLLDKDGHPLSTVDATTLAAVRTITDLDGTMSGVSTTTGTASATTIHSHSDNTLSGLLTSKHTLNGSTADRDTIALVLSGSAIQMATTATTTVSNLDIPTAAGAYPASGTITSDATTTESFGGTPVSTTSHASIAFNGTSVVTITLSLGSINEHCTLDLAHAANLACSS
jgi:hypothetical protein